MKRGVGPATGDARSVPSGEARFELRVRASRFLGIVVPCGSPEEARAALDRIRRELHDATHVAYAWTAGPARASLSRSSDDGEPAGTAGRPIASAVESAGLSDVLVAVVRWFGGTKLGTGGLARAYRDAAAGALAAVARAVRADTRTISVTCSHARVGEVRRLLRPPDVVSVAATFEERATIRLAVYRSQAALLIAALAEARLDSELEPEAGA